jgi:hypothetical protein
VTCVLSFATLVFGESFRFLNPDTAQSHTAARQSTTGTRGVAAWLLGIWPSYCPLPFAAARLLGHLVVLLCFACHDHDTVRRNRAAAEAAGHDTGHDAATGRSGDSSAPFEPKNQTLGEPSSPISGWLETGEVQGIRNL